MDQLDGARSNALAVLLAVRYCSEQPREDRRCIGTLSDATDSSFQVEIAAAIRLDT